VAKLSDTKAAILSEDGLEALDAPKTKAKFF